MKTPILLTLLAACGTVADDTPAAVSAGKNMPEAAAQVAIDYANECMRELQDVLKEERARCARLVTERDSQKIIAEGLASDADKWRTNYNECLASGNKAIEDLRAQLAALTTPPAPVARAFGEAVGEQLRAQHTAVLTKREAFAAMTMEGTAIHNYAYPTEKDAQRVAAAAVMLADALIAELER